MRWKQWMLLLALLSVTGLGCGGSDEGGGETAEPPSEAAAATQAKPEPPAVAVGQFLDAIRTGDDDKVSAMFTSAAREQISQLGVPVTPPGSDTATYKVGDVEYLEGGGARVKATWTDFELDGTPKTDKMLWLLRHSTDGWRIAGIAAEMVPGEPPLLLDFENLPETLRKLEMIRTAMQERAEQEAAALQAQRPAVPGAAPR